MYDLVGPSWKSAKKIFLQLGGGVGGVKVLRPTNSLGHTTMGPQFEVSFEGMENLG